MFILNDDMMRATRRFEASGRPVGRERAQEEAWRLATARAPERTRPEGPGARVVAWFRAWPGQRMAPRVATGSARGA